MLAFKILLKPNQQINIERSAVMMLNSLKLVDRSNIFKRESAPANIADSKIKFEKI